MKMLLICGVLLMFTGSAVGLITVDDQCRSDQSCVFYGAVGRSLYLQLPDEEELQLKKNISEISSVYILYFKNQKIRENRSDPRWQFNTENKTMIKSRAEKEDSGRYRLDTWDLTGKTTGSYYLHLIIEAVVSSVKVTSSCIFITERKVYCESDGDQIQFSWTLNGIPHNQNLTDGNQTLLLDEGFTGSVTCHVENHVSNGSDTVIIEPCTETTTATTTTTVSSVTSVTSVTSVKSVSAVNQCTQWDIGLMVFVTVWLFEVIILVSLLVGAFYIYTRIYRKQRSAESKE